MPNKTNEITRQGKGDVKQRLVNPKRLVSWPPVGDGEEDGEQDNNERQTAPLAPPLLPEAELGRARTPVKASLPAVVPTRRPFVPALAATTGAPQMARVGVGFAKPAEAPAAGRRATTGALPNERHARCDHGFDGGLTPHAINCHEAPVFHLLEGSGEVMEVGHDLALLCVSSQRRGAQAAALVHCFAGPLLAWKSPVHLLRPARGDYCSSLTHPSRAPRARGNLWVRRRDAAVAQIAARQLHVQIHPSLERALAIATPAPAFAVHARHHASPTNRLCESADPPLPPAYGRSAAQQPHFPFAQVTFTRPYGSNGSRAEV